MNERRQVSVETEDKLEVSNKRRPRSRVPRLLLTNDDGIESVGIQELAALLAKRYEVVVVAPEDQRSGAGTGIGFFDPVGGVTVEPVDLGDITAYSIAGPPGLAVMASMLGAFGDLPDLVVSGINAGINTGHSVIHSGTVGAVLTARTFGCDGLAVSLDPSDPWRWETAAALAESLVDWTLARTGPCLTINLNVPALGLDELKGLRWADLDEFGYFRVAIADIPGQRLQFEVGAPDSGLDPVSDTALLREGYATLTPLSSVEPTAFPEGPGPGVPPR